MDELLTVTQIAVRLNTSVRFARRLIEERRIPFHKIGRHVRVSAADLDRFVSASRVQAHDDATGGRAA